MNLLPHLERPLWLLLLPLLGWLLWRLWQRRQRRGRWQQILPAAFQPWLLGSRRGRRSRLPWLLLGCAWLLAVLALAGPGWQRLEQPLQQRGDPLVAILELTPAMLAADLAPSRLEAARRKLFDLLEARGSAPTAIVVYAGSAHVLVPLSDDPLTAHNLLGALHPDLLPLPGQRADLGVQRALELLEQGANGRGRLLLLAGRLDEQERRGIRSALAGRNNPLAVLGVGTASGAPIPREGGGWQRDAGGAILLPRLDAEALAQTAATSGGRYQTLRADAADLRALGLLDAGSWRDDARPLRRLDQWADQGYWLLLPLLLLAACAGRRGWLFGFALLLASPPPALAFDFEDLWRRADQQGMRLLEAGQPAAAAERFSDPQWRGIALYQAGDYAGAAQAFAEGNDAAAHYNRGNALALGGELEAALEAYEQALLLDPQLTAARHNRQQVERRLLERRAAAAAARRAAADEEHSAEADPDAARGQPAQTHHSTRAGLSEDGQRSAAPASLPERAPHAAPPPGTASPATSRARQHRATPDASPASTPDAPASAAHSASAEQDAERRQALEHWLRQIPDDPAELLRRKFWHELQHQQENPR